MYSWLRLSVDFRTVDPTVQGYRGQVYRFLVRKSRGEIWLKHHPFAGAACCKPKVFHLTYTGFTRCLGRSPQQCLSDTIAAPWPQVAALSCKARGGHSPLGELPQILNILMDLRCPCIHSGPSLSHLMVCAIVRAIVRFHAAQKHYRADWPLRGHTSHPD